MAEGVLLKTDLTSYPPTHPPIRPATMKMDYNSRVSHGGGGMGGDPTPSDPSPD